MKRKKKEKEIKKLRVVLIIHVEAR